jgi:hypothetical protein
MTKDKFGDNAKSPGKQPPAKAQGTTGGNNVIHALRMAPPAPSLTPKAPFGMPAMYTAQNLKVIPPQKSVFIMEKEDETKS